MNKIYTIFLILFCIGIWGCYPDKFDPEGDEVGPLPTLEFSEASLEFKAVSDHREVVVKTNYRTYRVNVPEEAVNWCHVTTEGMTLKIAVDENPFSRERSATISVSVARGSKELTKTVSVFQTGTLPQIKHSPSQLIFRQDEVGMQELTVTTNQDTWNFEKQGDWFTVERIGNTLKVTPIEANVDKEIRKGYITLVSSGKEDDKTAKVSVLLEQLGSDPALRLTENVFSLLPEGGVFRSRVITNQPSWKIYQGNDAWYEVQADGDEVVLTVDKNLGEGSRKTEIVIASGNDKVFENMNVAQLGTGLSLEISMDTVRVDAEESFATLWVTTNEEEWTATVENGDGWCELMVDANKLTVYTKAHTSTDKSRECIITVNAGYLQKKVCVIQAPDVSLELNHEFLQYEPDADVQNVLVMTNQAGWSVEVPDSISSWCTAIREVNVLKVSVASNRDVNKETKLRGGVIIVKAGEAGFEKRRTLHIEQKGVIPILTVDSVTLHCLSLETEKEMNLRANIPWKVEKRAEWLSVDPVEGDADALLKFKVRENLTVNERIDTVEICGGVYTRKVIVSQAGAAPVLTVDSLAFTCSAVQTERVLSIISNTSWEVLDLPSWVTVNRKSGTGSFALKLTFAAYTEVADRTGVFKVRTDGIVLEISVVQRGIIPVLTLSTESLNVLATGGKQTFTITSNQPWTLTGLPAWITADKTSGTGTSPVNLTVKENVAVETLECTLIISNKYVTKELRVVQAGATPVLTLSTESLNVLATGGKQTFTITSNQPWTLTGLPAWITADKTSGTGTSPVNLTVKENVTIQPLEVILTVSNQYVTRELRVTQSGAAPILTVDSVYLNCSASAGEKRLRITSNTDWQLTGLPSWIAASPENGNGNGTVLLKISANETDRQREVQLLVSGGGLSQKIVVGQQARCSLLPGGDVEDWEKDTVTGDMTLLQQERDVLIEFYYEMNGDEWTESTHWKSRRPLSEWKGVTTDAQGFVTGLSLEANQLSGNLTAILSKLTRLSQLNLSGNRITGTIPKAIQQIKGYDKSKIAPQRDEAGNTVYLTEE